MAGRIIFVILSAYSGFDAGYFGIEGFCFRFVYTNSGYGSNIKRNIEHLCGMLQFSENRDIVILELVMCKILTFT